MYVYAYQMKWNQYSGWQWIDVQKRDERMYGCMLNNTVTNDFSYLDFCQQPIDSIAPVNLLYEYNIYCVADDYYGLCYTSCRTATEHSV